MTINRDVIQNYIMEGDLERAIKGILLLARAYDKYLLNDATQLSARFFSLKREINAGTISNDNAAVRSAKITEAITSLLDQVKPDWAAESDESNQVSDNKPPAQSAAVPEKKDASLQEVILFLAANPKDTSRLRLDEESRRIGGALERSKHRDRFRLTQKWAVQIPDLRRALLDESPTILHFSGHGSELGRIYLEDVSGNGQEVPAEALGNLLKLFKDHLKCVVLNACYSEIQANEIVKHGIPVIGMSTAVPDKAGVEFSEAFYDALGAGRNIDFAFELGCAAISLYNLGAEDIPVLKKP
ncbi:MAG: CHAT domain-containing protein [Saprospiraceae bacterium]